MNVDLSAYSWPGVLEFLYTEYQKASLKQNIWFMEKKELSDQIKELEGKLAALEAINADLRNKNNMLQYSLRQLKLKNNPDKQHIDKQEHIPIPQRRPKSNKAHISKILCSLGITNLLDNLNKDLKAKAPNHSLKIEIPLIENKKHEGVPALGERAVSVYKQLAHLEQHQDGVRDLAFLSDKNYLISVSEDSTMKIWNTQKPKQKVECIGTIRQHSGPIFTAVEGQGLVFTGGMQGVIRCWNFPRKIHQVGVKKCLIGSWNNSQDQKLQPIWQLLYNSQRKMVFSTSSQIAIRAFQIQIEESTILSKYKCSYIYQSKVSEQEDIPTAICIHQDSLYAGYVNNNFLVEFNLETQKAINNLQFQADGQISTNRIASNSSYLVGAFEDAMIRVFDKSRVVHTFEAHDQSVMSLCFTPNPYELFSCGQDGIVKLWDLRKYAEVTAFKAHKKKYDEAGHCIASGRGGLIGSGGADGVIKIYGTD